MKSKGFSLIELLLALVIISLMLILISSSISLFKITKLNKVITESKTYTSAIELFQITYNELPGDIPFAYNLFGNSCASSAINCNGNGNGAIDENTTDTHRNEALRAWQHLGLAGTISKKYSGFHNTSGQSDIGVNVPASQFSSNTGWSISSSGSYKLPATVAHKGQYLQFGSFTPNSAPNSPTLTVSDAYSLDNKIDDGMPLSGLVTAYQPSEGSCYLGSTVTTPYNHSINSIQCALHFTFKKFNPANR